MTQGKKKPPKLREQGKGRFIFLMTDAGKKMRSKQQYIDGLRKMRRNIYLNGEKIARDDEVQMPTIHTMGLTFDDADDPKYEGLCPKNR